LERFNKPRTLLVQYVPHAFGLRSMNLLFAGWLAWRGRIRGDDVRVMFHEVAFPFVRRPLIHNALALAHRAMARILVAGCRRTYVSTPSWKRVLDSCGARNTLQTWLPVPSNIPASLQPMRAEIRNTICGGNPNAIVVGHFGTFGGHIRNLATAVFERLLTEGRGIRAAFIGRGADAFRDQLLSGRPEWRERVASADGLAPDHVAAWLQACDLAIQPYIDGISTRRTSAMAWLRNGAPLVSNVGFLSEPLWARDRPAVVAESCDPAETVRLATDLAGDPIRRAAVGRVGREYYDRFFALERTIEALVGEEL
jgi:hypothetical protein